MAVALLTDGCTAVAFKVQRYFLRPISTHVDVDVVVESNVVRSLDGVAGSAVLAWLQWFHREREGHIIFCSHLNVISLP